MIAINIGSKIIEKLTKACEKAKSRECGGILFGEHVSENVFEVKEITTDTKSGVIASFVRSVKSTVQHLKTFFDRYNHEYTKYNYMGEWHSHPQFALFPSTRDDSTMFDIIMDTTVGANFVISMIVKLDENGFRAQAWAYYPSGLREQCSVNSIDER